MKSAQAKSLSSLSGKRIIVSGAGIAGLSFVISLRALWQDSFGKCPEIVHYERENGRPDISREGYSISIRRHEWSQGFRALENTGLLDKLFSASITRRGDERGYHGLWSVDWRRLVTIRDAVSKDPHRSVMRIARTKLRQILREAAEEHGEIQWGVACTTLLPATEGIIRVALSNGKEDVCDLLIIADGANSKLRADAQSSERLGFAGPVSISAISRFPGQPPEPVSRDWGIVPSGKGVALFAAPMDERSANWSISYMADVPRKECRQPMSSEQCTRLLEEARELGSIFKEPFQTLLDHTDTSTLMVFNAMDKVPFAHGTANGIPNGVVFIGDSNHAVSPFAGNGANLALNDGYDLAECLCTHESVETAVEAYDKRSIPRALSSVRSSHDCIAVVHSSGFRWIVYMTFLLTIGGITSVWYACKDFVNRRRQIRL